MYRFSDVLISAPALIKNDRIKHKCTDFYMVLHLKHLLSTYVFTVRCLCMGMEGGDICRPTAYPILNCLSPIVMPARSYCVVCGGLHVPEKLASLSTVLVLNPLRRVVLPR